jgi:hypothetical protein
VLRSTIAVVRFRVILFAAAFAVAAALPAAGAGATFKFGSKLDSTVQPSNAESPHACNEAHPSWRCTWVMNEAYGRPNGGHKAQKRGTIKRIRLVAGAPGSFRLQIVRAHATAGGGFEGRAVRNGPIIRYQGQPDPDEPFLVETFRVNVKIRKGERLAIRARKTSILRCSSGGDNTLLFHPPLVPGGSLVSNTDTDGCWMLLEAVVRPG